MPNRLQFEKSPYLLQHANNPVDWFPWCNEAFALAKEKNVPVFLSIGYSTCHWCHVMERESFENGEVAELLNSNYISIKVDREEHPDIDAVYMMVCQLATGGGGWPLTIIMTPEKAPFFAGTYFPRTARHNRPGIIDILKKINVLWVERKEEILSSADELTKSLRERNAALTDGKITEEVFHRAYQLLEDNFDEVNGGFGNAPKFPSPHNVLFLLRYYHKTKNTHALYMAEKTLTEMYLGGIHDHVGGGFHRYSTDGMWLLPHFEKMLYDQAMLLYIFTEMYALTRTLRYKQCAESIIRYVRTCLLSPEGAFFSAEDADSEGLEGKFYVWSDAELKEIAGADYDLMKQVYNFEEEGNFSEPHGHAPEGTNILHRKKEWHELSNETGLKKEQIEEAAARFTAALYAEREKRERPLLDDKILADWNGLMIAAFARAGSVLNDPECTATAAAAAAFIQTKMMNAEGKLFHRYKDGEAKFNGNLEDYSYSIWGLLELYGATFDPRYILEAQRLTSIVLTEFKDNETGGFFFTGTGSEIILVRQKELYDGAIPSGNSVMMTNLFLLSQYTGEPQYEFESAQLSLAFGGVAANSPLAFVHFLNGIDLRLREPVEIVIAGDMSSPTLKRYIREIRGIYCPHAVLLVKDSARSAELLTLAAPYTEGMRDIDGDVMVYLCKNFACELPTSSLDSVLKLLGGEISPGGFSF